MAFLGCSLFSRMFPHDAGKGACGSGVEAPCQSVREIPRPSSSRPAGLNMGGKDAHHGPDSTLQKAGLREESPLL